jgi:hypothetical protein
MGATEAGGLVETKACDIAKMRVPTLSQPARGRDRWEIIAKSLNHVARWTGPTAIRFQAAFDFRTSAARRCCSCAICITWSSTRSLAPEPRCSILRESPPGRSWRPSVESEGSPYGGLPKCAACAHGAFTEPVPCQDRATVGEPGTAEDAVLLSSRTKSFSFHRSTGM